MDNEQLRNCVKFTVRRNITNLFKNFLASLQEIQTDYNVPDFIYQRKRKQILDDANNKIREIEELLDNIHMDFIKNGDKTNEK